MANTSRRVEASIGSLFRRISSPARPARGAEMPARLLDAPAHPHDPVAPVRVRERVHRIDVERLAIRVLRPGGRRAIARFQEIGPAEMTEEIRFADARGADD